jgi:HK97 family phage prohead protease
VTGTRTGNAKAALTFDCCITSTRRDRDGDVLESSGAEVDPRCPLLWQHIALQPIGRLDAITSRNADRVFAQCSIADTELGRDAATLVAFGALRISIGFRPITFEPLDRRGSDPGFRISKLEIMEISTVSIPSNQDAIITAFSREKLHHPLVKQYAIGLKNKLPMMVKGGWSKAAEEPCQGRCVRHLAKRLRRRLKAGKYPSRKSMRGLHKLVKRAIAGALKEYLVETVAKGRQDTSPPACQGPSQGPACICPTYQRGAPLGPDKMCRQLSAALVLGPVGIKTLNSLDRSLKAARKASKPIKVAGRSLVRGTRQYELVAHHEAGHAVIGSLLGLPIAKATVGGPAGLMGCVSFGLKSIKSLPPAEQALLNVSGLAAERWFGETQLQLNGQSDVKGAVRALKKATGSKPSNAAIARMAEKAAVVFREPGIHDAVKTLAAKLCGSVAGQMAGNDIAETINTALADRREAATARAKTMAGELIRWAKTFA